MSLGPRLREIFLRYGVDPAGAKVILEIALLDAKYRGQPPAEVERRLLRSVERRCGAWRDAAASAGAASAAPAGEGGEDGEDGENDR